MMDKKRTFVISSGVLSLALVISAAGVVSAHGGEDPSDTQRQGMGQMGGQGMFGDEMFGQGMNMMGMMHDRMGDQDMMGATDEEDAD